MSLGFLLPVGLTALGLLAMCWRTLPAGRERRQAFFLTQGTLIAGCALYLSLGHPGQSALPYASRPAALAQATVSELAAALARQPEDAWGWLSLAWRLEDAQQIPAAHRASVHTLALGLLVPEALATFARLEYRTRGVFTPASRQAIVEGLKLAPGHPELLRLAAQSRASTDDRRRLPAKP